MDAYGTISQGKIVIQQVDTLPLFNEYDTGRLIFVKEDGNYYVGGLRGWLGLAGTNYIKPHQLDIGTSLHQLNGNSIPIKNSKNLFTDGDSIDDVLEKLATGDYLKSNSIKQNHLCERSVSIKKLAIGTTHSTIGAQTLPYYDRIKQENTTIGAFLDSMVSSYPRIVNKTINDDDWQFDITNNLFFFKIPYENINLLHPIIQTYDQYGSVFNPSSIIFDINANKISIYVQYKMKVTVSIIG